MQYGYYTDSETGLQMLGHRYYDSGQGRFLTRDPAGYAGGVNLYAFAGNNPVMGADPSGLWDEARMEQRAGSFWGGVGRALGLGFVYSLSGLDGVVDRCPGWEMGGEIAGTVAPALLTDRASLEAEGLGEAGNLGRLGHDLEGIGDAKALCKDGINCFVAGTPVQMADGSTKPIEEISAGDTVSSRDPTTGVTESRRVVRTFRHRAGGTVTVSLADGDTLTCTPEHPFFVPGQGFTPAGDLAAGMAVSTGDGAATAVTGVQRQEKATEVYNLEVEGDHTYFVGTHDQGEWVHNDCRISPISPDWAGKGAHIHAPNGVGLKVRPGVDGTIGTIAFKPVFSSTPQKAVDAAIKDAQLALQNPEFRAKLADRVREAIPYVRNFPKAGGLARSGELRFLLEALQR